MQDAQVTKSLPIQMSELHAQNTITQASQGNLILVREKSGNCQVNLICSTCGQPARF